jgi:hypothetical protein
VPVARDPGLSQPSAAPTETVFDARQGGVWTMGSDR